MLHLFDVTFMRTKVLIVGAFVFALFLLITHTAPERTSSGAIENNSPASDTPPVQGTSSNVPLYSTDKVINVDATSLLSAYHTDEKAANARYKNRKVTVTGVLSGVFTTHLGFADSALVTMGESHALIIDETLRIPGISAYSEDSLLFGLRDQHTFADRLRVGKTVTLICTARDPTPVSETPLGVLDHPEYRVILRDCRLQALQIESTEAEEGSNTGVTPQVDQQNPVDLYKPCLQATQSLRVPEQIDLDGPADFSSSKEPRPQFTFLF